MSFFRSGTRTGVADGQGLIDAHGHVLEYGHYLQLPLAGSSSIQEIISRVETFVKTIGSALPEGAWIEGMGWNQNLWPGGAFPTAADLESSPKLKGKKISLARIDVHAEWVSQAIIDELESRPGGLPQEVDGGLIVRDEHGKPTGVFVRHPHPHKWKGACIID
jgi:predicted amidohydrolase YtcJ